MIFSVLISLFQSRKAEFASLLTGFPNAGSFIGANPLHASSPALFHTGEDNSPQQQPTVDDNAQYQTALACHPTHQFAVVIAN